MSLSLLGVTPGGWRDGYLENAAPASSGNMGTMRKLRKPCRHGFVAERPFAGRSES
jgi:hypothetical protein